MPRVRLRIGGAGLDPARAGRGREPPHPPVRGARLRLGYGRVRARRRSRPAARPLPRGGLRGRRVPERHVQARAHLQRPRPPGDDGRPRPGEHPPLLPRQLLVLPQRHDHALPAARRARRQAARGRHRLRGVLQLPDGALRRERPGRLASPRHPHHRRAAPPSAASTSSSRTATACSPTGSASSTCTGSTGPASCWSPRRRSRKSNGTRSSRTSCSCSTPTISRSRTPSG